MTATQRWQISACLQVQYAASSVCWIFSWCPSDCIWHLLQFSEENIPKLHQLCTVGRCYSGQGLNSSLNLFFFTQLFPLTNAKGVCAQVGEDTVSGGGDGYRWTVWVSALSWVLDWGTLAHRVAASINHGVPKPVVMTTGSPVDFLTVISDTDTHTPTHRNRQTDINTHTHTHTHTHRHTHTHTVF